MHPVLIGFFIVCIIGVIIAISGDPWR